jgi:hypothetical protein
MKTVSYYVALLCALALPGCVHAATSFSSRFAQAAAAKTQKLQSGMHVMRHRVVSRMRPGSSIVVKPADSVIESIDTTDMFSNVDSEYMYNQEGGAEYTVADIKSGAPEWITTVLKPTLLRRAAGLITPTELDYAVFEQCLDQFTLDECMALAYSKSPLLYSSNALLTLAAKETHTRLFEYLYQQLPDALTAKIFVRYVLMVRGQLEILDKPEYVALCKQFLTTFAPPAAFVPLQNQETIEALVASDELNDLLLLKALVMPEMVGVEGVRSIVPFMPRIVSTLSMKLPQQKEQFLALSLEHKRAAALALGIIILIGKNNEVVPDIYPWVAIFTEEVAARLYDVCLAAPVLLKHEEIMRLGLPASVGNHVGKLRFVPRNLAIKKIAGIMKAEEQKKKARLAA